jgi:hypothetical protein
MSHGIVALKSENAEDAQAINALRNKSEKTSGRNDLILYQKIYIFIKFHHYCQI